MKLSRVWHMCQMREPCQLAHNISCMAAIPKSACILAAALTSSDVNDTFSTASATVRYYVSSLLLSPPLSPHCC